MKCWDVIVDVTCGAELNLRLGCTLSIVASLTISRGSSLKSFDVLKILGVSIFDDKFA